MLRTLSGRAHRVITGLAIINISKNIRVNGYASTTVFFRKLSDREIQWYVNTGEPRDKAGAYGIQEKGCFLVQKVNGCYFNVVGLPVALLLKLLEQAGY